MDADPHPESLKIRCFEIEADGRLCTLTYEELLAGWRSRDGSYWIASAGASPAAVGTVLSDVGLSAKAVARIQQRGHAARVLPLDDALLLELPMRFTSEGPGMESIGFVCLDRLLVTLRESDSDAWLLAGEGTEPAHLLDEPSVGALLTSILVASSIDLRRRTLELRGSGVSLAHRLDDAPEEVEASEILLFKRQIVDLDAIGDERTAVLESLRAANPSFFGATSGEEISRRALANTTATARRLDRLDRRASDLQQRYDSHQQDRTNRRLSRLTIISAIFLPLTLVAGIYGMNFESMPELGHRFGYPIVIGAMTLTGVGLLWWFRRRGWME